jgi:hypothetical protein
MLQATEPEDVPRNDELYCAMARDDVLRARIARAREIQQDALVDQMADIAASATPEDWQVKRLQIWTRQWMAAKLRPKVYGDRQQVEAAVTVVKGGIDAPPRPATIEDAEQWLARRRKELAELDGPPLAPSQPAPQPEPPVPSHESPLSQHGPRYPEPRWPEPQYPATPQPAPPQARATPTGWTQQQEADWQRQQAQDEQRPEIGYRMPRLPR